MLAAVRGLGGPVEIDPTPQEVPWTVPLDEDDEHARYDAGQVGDYFAAATQAALVLAEFRAPYRGRSTPVNAWWGSFDLAVSLFSGCAGRAALGRLHHAQRDGRAGGRRRLVARRRPLRPGGVLRLRAPGAGRASPALTLSPAAARWDASLGEYVLDWDDVRASPDPRAAALEFARSAFRHACAVCAWDPGLAASADGTPAAGHLRDLVGAYEALAAERADALERLAGLEREFRGIVESAGTAGTDDEHDPEGATIAFERQHTAALLGQAREHLTRIDAAMTRLADGTYGICERCGQPIAAARLAARPVATTCMDCASRRGRRLRRLGHPAGWRHRREVACHQRGRLRLRGGKPRCIRR